MDNRLRLVTYGPLLVAAFVIYVVFVAGLVFQLRSTCPKSPWDAGITLEAARRLEGQPVYSSPFSCNASTMYGPVVPVMTSWIFNLFGVSNLSGKLLSLTASLTFVFLALVFTARRDAVAWLIGGALLLACNQNSAFYFVEARPDMLACLFSFLGIMSYVKFEESRHVLSLIGAVGLFILAFFTKQPLAAGAVVPLVCALLRRGRLVGRRGIDIGFALVPAIAIGLTVGALYITDPEGYYWMITVPGQYHISAVRALRVGLEILPFCFLLLLVVLDLAFRGRVADGVDSRWWTAAVVVFLPVGLIAAAKDGGAINSLLPFFLSASGFVILFIPRAIALIVQCEGFTGRRFSLSLFFMIAMIASTLSRPTEVFGGAVRVHGDDSYAIAVSVARDCPGRVSCPEDPTVVLVGRGELGWSAYLAMDECYWPKALPACYDDDLLASEYVIQVDGPYQRIVSDEWLTRLGFGPQFEPRLEGSVYKLWSRSVPE